MAENTDNLVLEQLKLIRSELGDIRGELATVKDGVTDLQAGQRALEGMIFSLAGYVRGIDLRGEHIEHKLGIDT